MTAKERILKSPPAVLKYSDAAGQTVAGFVPEEATNLIVPNSQRHLWHQASRYAQLIASRKQARTSENTVVFILSYLVVFWLDSVFYWLIRRIPSLRALACCRRS